MSLHDQHKPFDRPQEAPVLGGQQGILQSRLGSLCPPAREFGQSPSGIDVVIVGTQLCVNHQAPIPDQAVGGKAGCKAGMHVWVVCQHQKVCLHCLHAGLSLGARCAAIFRWGVCSAGYTSASSWLLCSADTGTLLKEVLDWGLRGMSLTAEASACIACMPHSSACCCPQTELLQCWLHYRLLLTGLQGAMRLP